MRRIFFAALLCSVAGCSASDPDSTTESLGETSQELNGVLSDHGFLVGGTFQRSTKNIDQQDETLRQQDTLNYYNSVHSSSTDTGASIEVGLHTLDLFRSAYGFGTLEHDPVLGGVANYYNRADLGLGREMHCVNRFARNGQIACYVTNYAAGQAGSEFTFGFSSDIAFANMAAQQVVATVAMVYRNNAPTNKVIFLVYNAAGELQNAAPLDRHGFSFAGEFAHNANPDPAKFGTPGVNFNNHVPSNCLNCHGGQYSNAGTPHVDNALFLPFDLDQFDYKNAAGFTQAEQEPAFRNMNQFARKVASSIFGAAHPVVEQIDDWYLNHSNPPSETLTGTFHGDQVPVGWAAPADKAAFLSVVRRSCRGCHMTSSLPFDTAGDFLGLADSLIGPQIGDHTMPHALQTQRLFWQSAQPGILAAYFNATGHTSGALAIAASGPANIVTLDPHLIESSF